LTVVYRLFCIFVSDFGDSLFAAGAISTEFGGTVPALGGTVQEFCKNIPEFKKKFSIIL